MDGSLEEKLNGKEIHLTLDKMKVKCITTDYSKVTNEAIQNILKVGDDSLLPTLGEVYEVIGNAYINGEKYYKIDQLESPEAYGIPGIWFNSNRFEIVDNTFVNNAIDEYGNLCRKENFYIELTLLNPKGSDSIKVNGIWEKP